MIILQSIIEIVIGSIVLGWSGNLFINQSVMIAQYFRVPPIITGIVLVGFGTSFPELIVAIIASWHHSAPIAIGNVIGSNIANIGLVLGSVALIFPMKVASNLSRREFPVLILVSVLIGIFLWNGYLSRIEGCALLVLLLLYFGWVFISEQSKQTHKNVEAVTTQLAGSAWYHALQWIFGLLLLFGSSKLLITGAVSLAKLFGLSDLVIGLTIVTIGTSLPELVATIVSAVKKHHDIAVGHIIGSNTFNVLGILAMPALIAPGSFSVIVFYRDFSVMIGFTVALWLFTFLLPTKGQLGRVFGVVVLVSYLGYLTCLFM